MVFYAENMWKPWKNHGLGYHPAGPPLAEARSGMAAHVRPRSNAPTGGIGTERYKTSIRINRQELNGPCSNCSGFGENLRKAILPWPSVISHAFSTWRPTYFEPSGIEIAIPQSGTLHSDLTGCANVLEKCAHSVCMQTKTQRRRVIQLHLKLRTLKVCFSYVSGPCPVSQTSTYDWSITFSLDSAAASAASKKSLGSNSSSSSTATSATACCASKKLRRDSALRS